MKRFNSYWPVWCTLVVVLAVGWCKQPRPNKVVDLSSVSMPMPHNFGFANTEGMVIPRSTSDRWLVQAIAIYEGRDEKKHYHSLIDLERNRITQFKGLQGFFAGVNASGKLFSIADSNPYFMCWHSGCKILCQNPEDGSNTEAFSFPNSVGRVCASANCCVVINLNTKEPLQARIYDLDSRQLRKEVVLEQHVGQYGYRFGGKSRGLIEVSPTGKWLAIAATPPEDVKKNGVLEIWNLETGQRHAVLEEERLKERLLYFDAAYPVRLNFVTDDLLNIGYKSEELPLYESLFWNVQNDARFWQHTRYDSPERTSSFIQSTGDASKSMFLEMMDPRDGDRIRVRWDSQPITEWLDLADKGNNHTRQSLIPALLSPGHTGLVIQELREIKTETTWDKWMSKVPDWLSFLRRESSYTEWFWYDWVTKEKTLVRRVPGRWRTSHIMLSDSIALYLHDTDKHRHWIEVWPLPPRTLAWYWYVVIGVGTYLTIWLLRRRFLSPKPPRTHPRLTFSHLYGK